MSETGDPTAPRTMRLTVDDLVLLDREWSKSDCYHSTELIDGVIYHTPARYGPRAKSGSVSFPADRDSGLNRFVAHCPVPTAFLL